MKIALRSERMVVISDLHIGNPFSEARRELNAFFSACLKRRYDICINGDGFEILQSSFATLARDSVSILQQLRRFSEEGLKVVYVVGNHDIALEHVLTATSQYMICPFVNLTSGERRIRIEHGHLYDPSFVKHPVLYEMLTRAAGPLLHFYPDVYRVWSRYQALRDRLRPSSPEGSKVCVYEEAADMLLRRGFDTVVFGHTHRACSTRRKDGGLYVNTGTWMQGGHYAEVVEGEVTLKVWDGHSL